MSTLPNGRSGNKPYPRDLTSPGPDQRRGVIPSQRSGATAAEAPKKPVPEGGDEPKRPDEKR